MIEFSVTQFLQLPIVQWGIAVAAFACFMILLALPNGRGGDND